jgi:1-acyl-sn-glycerol-3-phosphate acyltransferase
VLLNLVPKTLSELLFRSFEAKESFVQQVEEIRKSRPGQPVAFVLVSAGLIEFMALRRFLADRFGPDFEPRYATRLSPLLIEPFGLVMRRMAAVLKLGPKVPKRLRLISNDLAAGRPVVLNFEAADRKKLYETPLGEKEISYLQTYNPTTVLVPVVFVWRRKRRREDPSPRDLSRKMLRQIAAPFESVWALFLGDPYQPTGLRKIAILLRQYARSTIRPLEPLSILGVPPKTLRRKVFSNIAQEKKIILGPVYKSTRLIAEDILRSPSFARFAENLSTEEGTSEVAIYKKADSYLREIAARYSYFVIECSSWFLSWVFRTIFEQITVEEKDFERVRATAKEGPILFLPCHRSYVDFLLLSCLLFWNDINPPHIAAGINLNFWPAGNLFKGGGAFFIRRSFRGKVLYAEVLKRYVAALINNGISVEFFIEGARSRTGKLAPPKYGMLKMIADALADGSIAEKIHIFPISITYDRVTEDRAHKRELEGGAKVQESALGMVKAARVLFKNFGKVHVRFADPISLNDWMASVTGDDVRDVDARKLAIQKLAFEVLHRINGVMPVTSVGLVCLAMLAKPGAAYARKSDFEALLLRLKDDFARLGVQLTPELQQDYLKACRRAVARLIDDKVIEKYHPATGGVGLIIPEKQRIAALYYKNKAVHAFVDAAMAGVSKQDMSQVLDLRSLLRFEFFFADKESSIRRVLGVPSDTALPFYAFLIDDILETIQIGVAALLEMPGLWLQTKDWKNRLMQVGRTKILERSVSRLEAVNTQGFQAFLEMAKNLGWIRPSPNNAELYSPAEPAVLRAALAQVRKFRENIGPWETTVPPLLEAARAALPSEPQIST